MKKPLTPERKAKLDILLHQRKIVKSMIQSLKEASKEAMAKVINV